MIIHEWVGVDIKPRLRHTYLQTWPYQVLSVSSLRPIASITIAADPKEPKISKMSPSMSKLLTHKQQRGKCQHYQAKCPPRSIALAALSRLGASIRDQWAMIDNTPELENESAWFSWGYHPSAYTYPMFAKYFATKIIGWITIDLAYSQNYNMPSTLRCSMMLILPYSPLVRRRSEPIWRRQKPSGCQSFSSLSGHL